MPNSLTPFDGYHRIQQSHLVQMHLSHIATASDIQLILLLKRDAIPVLDAGFTEWEASPPGAAATISIGWDWFIDSTSGDVRIAYDDIRSNVMGVQEGKDIGARATVALLHQLLARSRWTRTVLESKPETHRLN